MSELSPAAKALVEKRAQLDRDVEAVLPISPRPAIDLCLELGLSWPEDAAELRESFLRLQAAGRARLVYGQGWGRA